MKKSFTMIELVFVIVIIGILAAIAIPKLWVNRNDALITKTKIEVANIRAGIVEGFSKNLMKGINKCPELEKFIDDNFFEGVIYPAIKANKDINWSFESNSSFATVYKLKIGNKITTFTYEKNSSKNCPFLCDTKDDLCKWIIQ